MACLAVKEVSVRFGGLLALDSVDLEVAPGMVTGLIGPNGAGKTTLFNVVTGLQSPTHGKVLLDDRDITGLRPHRRARLGLARTFQRLELFGTLTARENVQVAAESQRRRIPDGSSPARVAESLLDRVGLSAVADEPTDLLPTGLARLVELARSLASFPSVVLLDEPSAGLNHHETHELGEVLKGLAAQHMAVLLVEHDMSLVMGVCDHVTVLDFGTVIAQGDPASVRADEGVQRAYLGTADPDLRSSNASAIGGGPASDAAGDAGGGSADGDETGIRRSPGAELPVNGAASPLRAPNARAGRSPLNVVVRDLNGKPRIAGARPSSVDEVRGGPGSQKAPALELVDVHAGYGRIEVVHGVSLSVPEGGVVALLGPNGAGKTTLLRVASAQMAPTAGWVRFKGDPLPRSSPYRLARRGLCSILEGRGVFPNLTVSENLLMYTYRAKEVKSDYLEDRAYTRFPVLGNRRHQLAGRLSGGEQQMLALARVLYTDPSVLLLDELSMGLAPRVVSELYRLVAEAVSEEGISVLLVEQFAQTALELADWALVMVNGRIVRAGTPEEVGAELMRTYMGDPVEVDSILEEEAEEPVSVGPPSSDPSSSGAASSVSAPSHPESFHPASFDPARSDTASLDPASSDPALESVPRASGHGGPGPVVRWPAVPSVSPRRRRRRPPEPGALR